MSMSKKDFIALADVLKRVTRSDDGSSVEWNGLLDDLASFCKRTNSNFMRDRWLAYIAGECGPNGGEVKRKVKVIGNTQSAYDRANSTSPR